jgi:hypothetical protein
MDYAELTVFRKEFSEHQNANAVRVRLLESDAQYLLLYDVSVTVKGTVRYFYIRQMGLGVCEVGLAPITEKETRMSPEKHYIPELDSNGHQYV